MDWGPVISGLLVAILILLSVPLLTEDFDEEQKNQTLPTTMVQNQIEIPIKEVKHDETQGIAQMSMPLFHEVLKSDEKITQSRDAFARSLVRREEPARPDPRFAAPDAPLICTLNRPKSNFIRHETRAIGCCPEDDEDGTPYGPGKACCCGKIFADDGTQFCCEESCTVMKENERELCNRKQKSIGREREEDITTTTTTTETTTSTTTSTTSTTSTSTTTSTTSTTTSTTTTVTTTTTTLAPDACGAFFQETPKEMSYSCDNQYESGSQCAFSCPEPLRLNGTEETSCTNGIWSQPAPFCCMGSGCPADFKLDLFFVVDASSSIGEENFAIVRRFLKSIAVYFNVGQDTVRIGMISFNRKVTNILKLADVQNKADLDDAVDRIPYNGKGTNTGRALREVVKNAFREENGDRPDVQNQVVVITDGKSKDDIKTPGRALKKLAHVMAIGVGVKVRTKDLYEIATADEYIYTPESYAELEKLKYEVADKHCPPGCV